MTKTQHIGTTRNGETVEIVNTGNGYRVSIAGRYTGRLFDCVESAEQDADLYLLFTR